MTIHTELANGRWETLSLSEQLGNIGSEISRALAAKRRNKPQRVDASLARAFELFDFTVVQPMTGARRREVLRSRELVADYFYGDNTYQQSEKQLLAYFDQFAIYARRKRMFLQQQTDGGASLHNA